MPIRITCLILCGLFWNVCNADETARHEPAQTNFWTTDVIGIKEMHLSADYWINQTQDADLILTDEHQLLANKKEIYSSNPHMVDLFSYPDQVPGQQLKKDIQSLSKPNLSPLYDPEGKLLGSSTYRQYHENLDLDNIPESVKVHFALVVNRTDMRTYPTGNRYYKKRENQNLDRFQENGLFPGDSVAVLHTSKDKQWSFVQSYNYAAWVRNEDFAIGERQDIQNYKGAAHFLMITGDKVWTAFNPEVPALSEVQLDMGIRLPLAEPSHQHQLYGQNPYTSHTVLLPVRTKSGQLDIKKTLIPRNEDVKIGFLPFTRENIIRQAFKFLGERYGWGHSNNARDCTGFVMEVYKTFGIYMPRNTGQQGESAFGKNTRFNDSSTETEKLEAFRHLNTGDLIYVPGHVLMYIGSVDGKPYVIHDVSVFRYIDENGKYYEGKLNSVSVTPLIPLYGSRESSYLELMYNIKQIR